MSAAGLPMKPCAKCNAEIPAHASICMYCKAVLERPQSNHDATIVAFISIFGGIAVALLAFVALIGAAPSSFNGSNSDLYNAMAIYGSDATHEEADKVVEKISSEVSVSHRDAEKIAISCIRANMPISNCVSFGMAAKNLSALK